MHNESQFDCAGTRLSVTRPQILKLTSDTFVFMLSCRVLDENIDTTFHIFVLNMYRRQAAEHNN